MKECLTTEHHVTLKPDCILGHKVVGEGMGLN